MEKVHGRVAYALTLIVWHSLTFFIPKKTIFKDFFLPEKWTWTELKFEAKSSSSQLLWKCELILVQVHIIWVSSWTCVLSFSSFNALAAAAWGAVCTRIWWCPSYLVYSYLLLQSNELAHLTYSFYYSFLMNFEIRFSYYVSGSDHFFTSIYSFFKSNELPFTLNSSYWQSLCSMLCNAVGTLLKQ